MESDSSSSSYDTKSEVCLATEFTVNDLAKPYSQEQGLHARSTILSQCCSNPVLPVLSGSEAGCARSWDECVVAALLGNPEVSLSQPIIF